MQFPASVSILKHDQDLTQSAPTTALETRHPYKYDQTCTGSSTIRGSPSNRLPCRLRLCSQRRRQHCAACGNRLTAAAYPQRHSRAFVASAMTRATPAFSSFETACWEHAPHIRAFSVAMPSVRGHFEPSNLVSLDFIDVRERSGPARRRAGALYLDFNDNQLGRRQLAIQTCSHTSKTSADIRIAQEQPQECFEPRTASADPAETCAGAAFRLQRQQLETRQSPRTQIRLQETACAHAFALYRRTT